MAVLTPSARQELLMSIRGDAVDGCHLAVEADGVVVAAKAGEGVENNVVELGGEWGVSGTAKRGEGFGSCGDVAGAGEGDDGLAEGGEELGAREYGVVGAGAGTGENELQEAPERGEAARGSEAGGEERRQAVVGAERGGRVRGGQEDVEVERGESRVVTRSAEGTEERGGGGGVRRGERRERARWREVGDGEREDGQ
nr:unnamed protein product [Digitaria exilis]